MQKHKVRKRTKYDPNKIIDCGDHYEICLYSNKHKEVTRALIDKEDLDKVKDIKWCLHKDGYAWNNEIGFLHFLILGRKENYLTDHRNQNKLDNRKQNLRFATNSQNAMNRRNTSGVTWNQKRGKWLARISVDYKNIFLGRFVKKEDAIKARKNAEIKYFGEFRNKEK